jgi:hypothetical protein
MDYPKIVEMVPPDKWAPLSEELIGVILGAKNDDKIPNSIANSILMDMKTGKSSSKQGLTLLMEVAVVSDPEKTIIALGDLQLLNVASEIIQAL